MARFTVIGTNRSETLREGPQASSDIRALGGNDKIFLTRDDDLGGDNRVDAGKGHDQVVNRKESGNVVKLGAGNDKYFSDGFAFSIDRPDLVRGGPGNDLIAVSTFHSVYTGDNGNDSFLSVGWQNVFVGGAGKDKLSYAFRHTDTTIGDTGVSVDLPNGKVFTGTSRFETIRSIETIIGSIHADLMQGDDDANTLDGFDGDDQIAGAGGPDVIIGGKGADLFAGGTGADVFLYRSADESTAAATDGIIDLNPAEGDKIDLSRIDANASAGGDQAFVLVTVEGGAFAGRLLFKNGFLQGDINGDGTAELVIQMQPDVQLTADDLIL